MGAEAWEGMTELTGDLKQFTSFLATNAGDINSCTERREALQQKYEDVNVGIHRMGEAVWTACGCVETGGAPTCAFKDMGAACTVPYENYVGAFDASSSLWDAVKTA